MTKLEKELQMAILDNGADYAKAAAEVAKRYIVKAIIELSDMNTERIDTNEWRERWLKENGVTGEVNS